jgi:hypothetical protein
MDKRGAKRPTVLREKIAIGREPYAGDLPGGRARGDDGGP